MQTQRPRVFTEIRYREAAEKYLRSLPVEHFMEAVPQGTQREVTLASLALLRAARADVHVYNELLVQYPLVDGGIGQVVPDNAVVVWAGPIRAVGSYDIPLQPVRPFLVMQYVSRTSRRKDYGESFRKYEQELKVPYYLLFVPEVQEMNLFHLEGERYVSVPPNGNGRCAIPELEMEVGVLDGWGRYWHRGKLLPLPADLQRALDEVQRKLEEANRRAEEEARRADEQVRLVEAERQARLAAEEEMARLRAELERLRQPKRGEG